MSVKTSKRSRVAGARVTAKSAKRSKPPLDDEIPSDSDEDISEKPKVPKEQEDSDLDEETAQEKKLRLTKKYLEELKSLKAQDGEDEEDAVGAKLKEDVLEQAGRLQRQVAEKCQQPQPSDVKVLRGHKLSVTCVVVSSDERFIFSASKDCCIIKWDAKGHKKLHKIKGGHLCDNKITHTAHILCLAITTDSEFLVSGGVDSGIHVWKVDTCEHIYRFIGHRGPISGLSFRLNSHQLFSSSHDRCVKVWDLDAMGYVETLFGHEGKVQACDSLTRERCATAGGMDGSVRIWKIAEESQLVYHGHAGSIDCLKLINEQHFISGADGGSVCLWSVMKKKPIVTKANTHPNSGSSSPWISSVAALMNSDLVATGSSNGVVKLWKCGTKFLSMDCMFEVPVQGFINGMQFSPSGDKLYVAVGQEHKLGRWWRMKEARNSVVIISLSK